MSNKYKCYFVNNSDSTTFKLSRTPISKNCLARNDMVLPKFYEVEKSLTLRV